MVRKPTDYVQFKLRIRDGLRRKIEREAERKAISANNEAVERIERSFRSENGNLLRVIVHATLGGEPKWITPDDGRELRFSPSVKAQMKQRIADFIDSLPEAAESDLSDEEFEALSRVVDEAQRKIDEQKKGRGK